MLHLLCLLLLLLSRHLLSVFLLYLNPSWKKQVRTEGVAAGQGGRNAANCAALGMCDGECTTCVLGGAGHLTGLNFTSYLQAHSWRTGLPLLCKTGM